MPLQLLGLAGILTWAMSSVSLPAILNATRTLQEKQQSSTTPIHSSWAFLVAMTTVISSWSTMSLNIADISRFAKSQRAQALGQLAGFVLPNVAVATVGILTTGAASALYPAKAGSCAQSIGAHIQYSQSEHAHFSRNQACLPQMSAN